jgi:peptidoglycan hydrolase-like protein with peptidoglycan-binding domain
MSHVLIKGIRSPLVPTLKSWLNVILKPSPRLDQNDNKFDEATFDAVVRFQTVEGLHPDGKVGSGTWGALGKEIGGWDFPLELIAILPDWLKKLVTGKPQVLGAMAFNPSTFVGMYMKEFGGMKQSQIDGLELLLGCIELDPNVTDIRWAAYMLATVKWECGDSWQPIEEDGKGAGHPYGTAVQVRDTDGAVYNNTYYGRGYVQLTWKANYEKLSQALNLGNQLVIHPEKALDPGIAYSVMSYGMRNGSFTGKKLSDFIYADQCDYKNARKIINGLDQWAIIKGFAEKFEAMLQASLGP